MSHVSHASQSLKKNNLHPKHDWDETESVNSHLVQSRKKVRPHARVPRIDLSKVEPEASDEEEDIDKMIEEAIELELEQNPDIANQFDSMDEFKRYIFDKYFQDYKPDSAGGSEGGPHGGGPHAGGTGGFDGPVHVSLDDHCEHVDQGDSGDEGKEN